MGCFKYLFVFIAISFQLNSLGYYQYEETDGLNFNGLQNLIETNKSQSIEDTLSLLKAQYPVYFSNYILMHRSRSLQLSSPEAPRVLLVGRSGTFVMSFNGDPKHRGYDSIETMEFNKEENKFIFREISFSDNQVKFSKENPAKCLDCHQSLTRAEVDPRPNWEPYSFWPGAYGAEAGRIGYSSSMKYDERFQAKEHNFLLAEQSVEEENIKNFLENVAPEHPRYKWLGDFDPHVTVDFTDMLSRWNFRRMIRLIQSVPKTYETYKYALLSVAKCQTLGLPKPIRVWHETHSKPEYVREYQTSSAPAFHFGYGPGGEDLGLSAEDIERLRIEHEEALKKREPSYDVSRGIQTLFSALGFDTRDWSMDFKTEGKFAFRERFGTPSNTWHRLREAIEDMDPVFFKTGCKDLKSHLAQVFETQTPEAFKTWTQSSLKYRKEPNLVQRCSKCHVDDDRGEIPYIPFNDPTLLSRWLNKSGYKRGTLKDEILYRTGEHATFDEQMPPRGTPTRDKRQELVEYLNNLDVIADERVK